MGYWNFSRFELSLVFMCILCFLCMTTRAADPKSDITGFLLGRILKNGDRLDKIEERLGDQIAVKENGNEAIRQDIIDAVVKDAIVRSGQVSRAFGVEKKNIRAKSEEMSHLTTANRNDITKLELESNQTFIKMNNVNQSLVRLQDDFKDRKRVEMELFDKFQLELRGLKDEVENGIKQSDNLSDKIDHNITTLAKIVSDVKSQLNELANQIGRDTDKMERQIETLSDRVTDIQQETNKINLATKIMKNLITCPSGWSRQLDSCILYVTEPRMNWADAQEYCRSKHGMLAEPYTDESFDLLFGNTSENNSWFLGARYRDYKWVWESSSTPMKLKRWPNLSYFSGKDNCLIVVNFVGNIFDEDIKCSTTRSFICEIKI